jgi:hypothetical protein
VKLLIALMLCASNVYAVEAPTPDTTDKVLQRADKVGEWVSTTLTTLADKLGTSVELLWPAFVREQLASGIGLLVGAAMILAFGLSVFWYLGKCRAECMVKNDRGYYIGEHGDASTYQTMRFMLLVFCMCFVVPMIVNSIPYLVSPEALALKSILNSVSK